MDGSRFMQVIRLKNFEFLKILEVLMLTASISKYSLASWPDVFFQMNDKSHFQYQFPD